MSKCNPYDESDYAAFRDNESKIKTDDREMDELDEFSPDQLDENMFIMQNDEETD